MHIKSLSLQNFRLHEDFKIEWDQGINIIQGRNACGKTSLLEAIYVLMTGRSFRTTQVKELIRHGTQVFHVEATFVKHGVDQKVSFAYNGKERRIFYNSTQYPSTLSLLGILQGVVIYPDDVAIAKGAPSIRRHFIDMQMGQTDPLYVHHLTRYYRAMQQRNALLKDKNLTAIELWEYEMAKSAAYIICQRSQLLEKLDGLASTIYGEISGGREHLQLSYRGHGVGESSTQDLKGLQELYCDQYARHRQKELLLGTTLTGPHKDDFVMTLNGLETRAFGSEGQQRACVIALRLAEWRCVHNEGDEKPLMLIDDIGVSLDMSRRIHLAEKLAALGQVLVTTADELQMLRATKTHKF